MAGLNLNKKLWRIPQQGMVRGVCAGLAHYLDVPVKLVRVVTVLSIFFGGLYYTGGIHHPVVCTRSYAGR